MHAFVEGKTLKDLLEEGRRYQIKNKTPPPECQLPRLISLFKQICEGVASLHARNVLHGGLKPSSILVRDGEAVILDVKQVENSKKEHPQFLDGTPVYIAPEQLFGSSESFQTDIYALGMILYELLTLRHPFHRSSLEALKSSLEKEVLVNPLKIASARPIPKGLVQIALKCLETAPENRFQKVSEILQQLQSVECP